MPTKKETKIKVWDHGTAKWKLTHPNGKEVFMESLHKYCNKFGLNYQMILRKHRSNDDPYKNYKLEKVKADGTPA